ncbi:RNA-directed DNA polymerase [Photobacterium damselae subsp. damselae]|uniref:antiviral reverse transcriptase Drt3b n=1 Tax=Photobacterium damselae TaxID=38293 RepID=UPI0010FED000|nr:antiviral reverse transcriptase Drt3b [Photobacterium damselae]TLS83839.1 RNA-directed DNA polymerase [Photobacterium damselae subsp. damselae]TLS91031.1 RNA-directed DNA polymerase [Photobacterium damselae subsp. damselae]
MSKEIKINKHDYVRVVLTDVQPYELPFIVTNEGFYSYIKNNINNDFLHNLFLAFSELKPYDFKITKSKDSYRKLSLIHPYSQYKFISFYRDNHSLIKSKCSISKYSLRYPVDIALYYYSNKEEIESQLKDEGVDIITEEQHLIPAYASSFFTYKQYNFLYKFYDSYGFHRIERQFSKLHKFDISKCFENLSIEMLPMALRGEDLLRSGGFSDNSFESKFSKILSSCNYGRHHGIVIGPEFSRIYAEIILQKIDLEIEVELKKNNIKYGSDYIIKRYVDDYFLFFNDDRILPCIMRNVLDCLAKYKLFINESKNEDHHRPFITGVTSAKMSISCFFDELFNNIKIDVKSKSIDVTAKYYNHYNISNKLITKLKCIINSHNINYDGITGYFFTILRKKISEIRYVYTISKVDNEISESISRFILIISELMFFLHSMDGRVRSTYLISEIIIQISGICKYFNYESEQVITDKIMQEAKFSIKHAHNGIDNVESLNLVLSLKILNTENRLSIDDLRKLLHVSKDDININYFQLIVGLYFVEDNSIFSEFKIELCNKALNKVFSSKNPLQDSESIHILFDLISFPHLDLSFKKNIVKKLYNFNVIPSTITEDDFYNEIANNKWFVDWSELSIQRLLKKKQLRSPY